MKITTFKLLQTTFLFCVLILVTIARNSHKSYRKHKSKNTHRENLNNNSNNPNKSSQKPKVHPIVIAKEKCQESCEKELNKSMKNSQAEPDKIPIRNKNHLYIKKKAEDTEFYLCECLLFNGNQVVQKEFYFANKSTFKIFIKNDDDGRKVYKKKLKKGLSDSQNSMYQIVD